MLTKRIITGSKKMSAVVALSVLAAGGCQSAASSPNNAANNSNVSNSAARQTSEKMIIIQQGTVGKIGDFSVGVRNVTLAEDGKNSTADFAVWNTTLTQEKRNDYNIKFTVKSGTAFPVGNKFYKIVKISSGKAAPIVEIEPVGGDARLGDNALAIPVGGNLELHGAVVEVVSVKDDGKRAAIEIYSNDLPKEDLAKKDGGIVKSEVAAGDEIRIGGLKHKIIAVHAAQGGSEGILEISIAPVK